MSIPKRAAALSLLLGIGVAAYLTLPSPSGKTVEPKNVVMPTDLSQQASVGKTLFGENCAACHGESASGTEQGPPLVHRIYEPSHHADYSFVLAAKNGVRAHHWPFGDMPPVPDVGEPEMSSIVAYVRAVQRANGIN